MKKEIIKCCICGREFEGFGNNPDGAMYLDDKGNPQNMSFEDYERCCDQCNTDYVIPGRLYKMTHRDNK